MGSDEASLLSPKGVGSKWQIPLVLMGGAVLWILVTWVKWFILTKRHASRDNEKGQNIPNLDSISGKRAAEALKAFHERQRREERAKLESFEGQRTLVEEVEERARKRARLGEEEVKNGKDQKPEATPKYTREMFEDSGSPVYKEMMVRRKREEEEKEGNVGNVANVPKERVQVPKYSPEMFEDSASREMGLKRKKVNAKGGVKEGLEKKEVNVNHHHHQGQNVKVDAKDKQKGSVKLE